MFSFRVLELNIPYAWTLFCFQENHDLLIKCISQDLGFSKGRPIAACLIYKSLLQWRSFEVERTNIFDRIIQTISAAIEVWSHITFICQKIFPIPIFPLFTLL